MEDDCPEAEQVACVSIGRRHPEVNGEMTLKDKQRVDAEVLEEMEGVNSSA